MTFPKGTDTSSGRRRMHSERAGMPPWTMSGQRTERGPEITSEELAAAVETAVHNAKSRILGVGREQYETADGAQNFETMSLPELARWAAEEAEDLIVYGVMLQIRAKRIEREIKRRGL